MTLSSSLPCSSSLHLLASTQSILNERDFYLGIWNYSLSLNWIFGSLINDRSVAVICILTGKLIGANPLWNFKEKAKGYSLARVETASYASKLPGTSQNCRVFFKTHWHKLKLIVVSRLPYTTYSWVASKKSWCIMSMTAIHSQYP